MQDQLGLQLKGIDHPLMQNNAYLSLGSNIKPKTNLVKAIKKLSEYGTIKAISKVMETRPLRNRDQNNYLNAAIMLTTPLSAHQLKFECIHKIETSLGRQRSTSDSYSSRTIDIDIMLFNHEIIQIGKKRIPDSEILERDFVAICLADIAPNYIHPDTKQTLLEISNSLGNTNCIKTHDDIIQLK